MMSLGSVYEESCRASKVQPNSALCRYFTANMAAQPLHVLSLSSNLVGPRGLEALLPVLHLCRHTLHTLDLSYNNLDNRAIQRLTRWLMTSSGDGLPALRRLELQGNPFTYQAGKCLVHCCEGLRPVSVAPPAAPAASPGNEDAGPGSHSCEVNLDATADAPRFWEESPGMNIDSVGVKATLMPPGLEDALRARIAEAIARRVQRRIHQTSSRQPSQRQSSSVAQSSKRTSETAETLAGKESGAQQSEAECAEVQPSAEVSEEAAPAHVPFDLLDEPVEAEGREGELGLDEGAGSVDLSAGKAAELDERGDGNALGIDNNNDAAAIGGALQAGNTEAHEISTGNLANVEVPHTESGTHTPIAARRSFATDCSSESSNIFQSHTSSPVHASLAGTARTALPPLSEDIFASSEDDRDEQGRAGARESDAASLPSPYDTATDATSSSGSPSAPSIPAALPAPPARQSIIIEEFPAKSTGADILAALGLEAQMGTHEESDVPPSWLDDV
ncbi:hypothetical protein ABL78_4757 [Leptomonas seymouri]|uniref:Leucine rich repeat protein n=1 Tax=Leptomonas seymouri TaxID=5684 RepID=A0A0N1IJY6_LEPSE|nr:hypothetical protein ABL78_4757 [Leptomonas seymouri]|eukprot:KPI86168.1 hypothetical protein ABL78_4757 [Leptomonas seymouri]